MSTYAKKVLGMTNVRPALTYITNSLGTGLETPRHYGKPKYNMEHMKNFLDKLQTPAEIRREEQKKREKENHPDESSKDIPDNDCEQEEKEEEVEVVAKLNEARIEFGNGCFMRF